MNSNKSRPLLSVVIISHQQKDMLRRCIESVLQQKTNFLVEVIVSDDRSTDGTREMLAEEYAPKGVLITLCNSNDGLCEGASRATYNRKNALKLVHGKYLIHIDGDDYFTSTDLFQAQVNMPEQHPECTICSQNWLIEETNKDSHNIYAPLDEWSGKDVISVDEYMNWNGLYIHNSVMCMRLTEDFQEKCQSARSYDDMSISILHMNRGKIAMLNRRDFIYTKSNAPSLSKTYASDSVLEHCLALKFIEFSPWCCGTYLRVGLRRIKSIAISVLLQKKVSERAVASMLNRKYVFLLRALNNQFNLWSYLRAGICYVYSKILIWTKLDADVWYRILYFLAVDTHIDKDLNFSRLR